MAINVIDLAKKAIEQGNTELLGLLVKPHRQLKDNLLAHVKQEVLIEYKNWISSMVLLLAVQDLLDDVEDFADYNYEKFNSEYLIPMLDRKLNETSLRLKIEKNISVLSGKTLPTMIQQYKSVVGKLAKKMLVPLFEDKNTLSNELKSFVHEQTLINEQAAKSFSIYEAKGYQDNNVIKISWYDFIQKLEARSFFPEVAEKDIDGLIQELIKDTPVVAQDLPRYCLLTLAMETYYREYDAYYARQNASVPVEDVDDYLQDLILKNSSSNIKAILASNNINLYASTLKSDFIPYEIILQRLIVSAKQILTYAKDKTTSERITTLTLHLDQTMIDLARQHNQRMGNEGTLINKLEAEIFEEQRRVGEITKLFRGINASKAGEQRADRPMTLGFLQMILPSTSSNQEDIRLQMSLEGAFYATVFYNQTGNFTFMTQLLSHLERVIYRQTANSISFTHGLFFSQIADLCRIPNSIEATAAAHNYLTTASPENSPVRPPVPAQSAPPGLQPRDLFPNPVPFSSTRSAEQPKEKESCTIS